MIKGMSNEKGEVFSLGGDRNEIFLENEKQANRILAAAELVSAGVFGLVWILSEMEVFYVYHLGRSRILFLIVIGMLLSGILFTGKKHREKRRMKYHLMGTLILALAIVGVVFTHNVTILMILPMVLSARYFIPGYTIHISAVSLVVFSISTVIGAFIGDLDLNCLEMPVNSVIAMKKETWIYDVIMQEDLPYDRLKYVKNVLLYRYLVSLLQAIIVSVCSVAMAAQGRSLILKQRDLAKKTAMTDAELTLAAKIQADVLPSKFPAFPERSEFDIYATMEPAKEVGGDFYDFFFVDEDHLYLCIADVSGKGIPAAMFMMAARNVLAEQARCGHTPAQILAAANRALCVNNTENMFVTAWVGILQISTGRLCAVSAGHEYPVVKKRGGKYELLKDEHGFPLGWFDAAEYKEYEIQLAAESVVFCYTDGVTEAMDPQDRLFGTERLLEALNADAEIAPEKVLEKVRRGVADFVKDAEQFDDLTMLGVLYRP